MGGVLPGGCGGFTASPPFRPVGGVVGEGREAWRGNYGGVMGWVKRGWRTMFKATNEKSLARTFASPVLVAGGAKAVLLDQEGRRTAAAYALRGAVAPSHLAARRCAKERRGWGWLGNCERLGYWAPRVRVEPSSSTARREARSGSGASERCQLTVRVACYSCSPCASSRPEARETSTRPSSQARHRSPPW